MKSILKAVIPVALLSAITGCGSPGGSANEQVATPAKITINDEQLKEEIRLSVQENDVRIAKLDSYKIGVTTLVDFNADKWNASDPYQRKLGIIIAKRSKNSDTEIYEYDLGYYAKRNDELGAMMQDSYEFNMNRNSPQVGFITIMSGQVRVFPGDHWYLKFVDGKLVSIRKE